LDAIKGSEFLEKRSYYWILGEEAVPWDSFNCGYVVTSLKDDLGY